MADTSCVIWRERTTPPNPKNSTIRPRRAGSLPAKPVARRGKKRPCYTRSTTRTGQAWRHIVDDNGNLRPFRCPQCGSIIVFDMRGFVGCGNCSWAPNRMTPAERADLERRDPEMVPILQFLENFEQFVPRFEGNANLKKISGKERREKRFLSKCAAFG